MSRIMNKKSGAKDRIKVFFSASKAVVITSLLLISHIALAVYVGNAGYDVGYYDGQQHVKFTVSESTKVKELQAEIDRLHQEGLSLANEYYDSSKDSSFKVRKLHKKLIDCRKELKVAGEFEEVFMKSFEEYNRTAK